MLTIETKRIEISQVFKRKIEMLGKFTNTIPTILNGEVINIKGTNIAYTKPHQVIINNNIYLIFEESDDVFINTLYTKIKYKDLEDFIKSNKDLTNDLNAFLNDGKNKLLIEEFEAKTSKKMEILTNFVEVFKFLGINTENNLNEDLNNDKIESTEIENNTFFIENKDDIIFIKNQLNSIVRNIVKYEDCNPYGNHDEYNRFSLYAKLDEDNIQSLLNSLPKLLDSSLFSETIEVELLFECINVKATGEEINVDDLLELYEIYVKVKNDI